LFDDYKNVKLEIWHTFTDTTMEKILWQMTVSGIPHRSGKLPLLLGFI
jgi:hypothetical protein